MGAIAEDSTAASIARQRSGGECEFAQAALRRMSAVELWERFSFYSMFNLLPLFLIAAPADGGFGWSQGEALALFGLYVGAVYTLPFVGGVATDRWLGNRAALYAGAVLMLLGHLALALPHLLKGNAEAVTVIFYAALVLLALGNALFKPNISVLVGRLPHRDEAARDAAFTTFYVYVNIGGLLASLVAGLLATRLGWHWAFGAAALGMLVALVLMRVFGPGYLDPLMQGPGGSGGASPASGRESPASRSWAIALAVVLLVAVLFVMCSYQMAGLMNVFTSTRVDRGVLGFEVPPSWFIALNPLFIILFAPLLARFWRHPRSPGHDWTASQKFGCGFLLVAGAFLLLRGAAQQADAAGLASPIWLLGCYLSLTLGELMIGPVSTAAVSRLSPPRHATVTMGGLFAALGLGGWLSGQVGAVAASHGEAVVFGGIAGATLGATVLLWSARAWLQRRGV